MAARNLLSIACLLLFAPQMVHAQTLTSLMFRGPLRNAQGQRWSTPIEASFRIYDAPVGGNRIAGPFGPWTLVPESGVFTTTLGPIPLERVVGNRAWLEVTAGSVLQPRQLLEKIYYDHPGRSSTLAGGRALVLRGAETPSIPAATATTILSSGPSSNRLDIVFVGDGYTASQLDLFALHVDTILPRLFANEPFASYSSFFNVHRVDVVSNESGVDNDPAGTLRDTALDMGFGCYGSDRLLCLSLDKAFQYAQSAPQAEYLVALANTSTYGGTGFPLSHAVAISGGNNQADELLAHESGHGIANLADEYDYDAPGPYVFPEPAEPNVSTLPKASMAASGTKWAPWLGDPGTGFNGTVDTYEGAYYHRTGIYRPTLVSKMRTLGYPYNLPSVEALIVSFYHWVHPIDDATATGTLLDPNSTLFVDPVDPPGGPLEITWYLDGHPLPGATQDTLHLASYSIGGGPHTVSVRVRDNTPWVRNEGDRAAWLTETRSWSLYNNVNALLQSRPNPFAVETTIHYVLTAAGKVTIRVFDSTGRKVRTLVDEDVGSGLQSTRWAGDLDSGMKAPTGIYYYRIEYPDGKSSVRKLVKLR